MRSIQSQHEYSDTLDEFLSGCGQWQERIIPNRIPHERFYAFAA
jgi:hypothetical protein